ncbi:molybdopterin-guanine dinucleotide biosynthesis protein B [Lacticaseibacillus baoqingensis]|uniref:Molybdopterin-guanine dinucleotide biosynthesis protein B n=1 Tax=Lacticaseibacillus baoqingensis TaxID=2486013 RepID=A0ABW4E7H9_9LACO|nr:molybdopterin-guanine dinucleotide biosynthesis protein MobB [Lacticaseibacillus baoqingensis]
MVAALQVIGHKKSGKTTVVNDLIQAANALALSVSTLKHTHEPISAATDSGRFAAQVPTWLLTPTQTLAYSHATTSLAERVKAIVNTCATDLLLIEGAKALAYPKLVLLLPGETPTDWAKTANIAAFATLGATNDPQVLTWQSARAASWLAAWYAQQGGV